MYIYPTAKFRQNQERFLTEDIVSELNLVLAPYSAKSLVTQRVFFEPFGQYVKRRHGDYRIIAEIKKVDAYEVLVLLDIFRRDNSDYDQIVSEPKSIAPKFLSGLYTQEEIEDWLLATTDEQDDGDELDPLPEEFRSWLEPPAWDTRSLQESLVIYESEEWVKRFQQSNIIDHWEDYYRLTLQAADERPAYGSPDLRLKVTPEGTRAIAYCPLHLLDNVRGGERNVLFLVAPFDSKPTNEQIEWLKSQFRFMAQPNREGNELSLVDVVPYSRRSYPDFMLGDKDVWFEIEKEKEANLALSAEEELLLEGLSLPHLNDASLPVFINGRAGSGKSTMLYYLFADYCFRKISANSDSDNNQASPIFLTYNDKLVDVARKATRCVLKSHHKFLQKQMNASDIDEIDQFFRPFQTFLLSLLPENQREAFEKERYVSFQIFKEGYSASGSSLDKKSDVRDSRIPLWMGMRRYSPELCWYVIRTFIKGYDLAGFLTPEDYKQDVPRKERVVSPEAYEWVYDKLWSHWYGPKVGQGGFWDDQDLIRAVLNQEGLPTFTAIFCDEAQDFTRLELQLIMRLSVFSKYDLGDTPLHCLPFAFAGDPFQTLNPTGFRWSNIQAAFHDKVLSALDPLQRLRLDINFQELSFNYRSTAPIVKANNLIQLWRRVLFDHKDLQPQQWWQQHREERESVWFVFGKNASESDFLQSSQNTIILLPCESGDVAEFVANDPVLRQLLAAGAPSTGIGSVRTTAAAPRVELLSNALTAAEAKGLEFDKVVLYKFGEACGNSPLDSSTSRDTDQISEEYFFNKLYVAASRARQDLFIVETPDGYERLWKYAEENAIAGFLSKTRHPKEWESHVQGPRQGKVEDWDRLRQTDPVSIAQEFEQKGMRDQNPEWLHRASLFYRSVGKNSEADRCNAWKLRYEGKLLEAGKAFEVLNRDSEAADCLWEGMHWRELLALGSKHNLAREREQIATFLSSDPRWPERTVKFAEFLGDLLAAGRTNLALSKQWRTSILELAERCRGINADRLESGKWAWLGTVLEAAHETYPNKLLLVIAGECSRHGINDANAVRQWDLADLRHPKERPHATKRHDYYLAQAAVHVFPNNLEWLDRAREPKLMIDAWEAQGGFKGVLLNARFAAFVGKAFERLGNLEGALRLYEMTDDYELLRKFVANLRETLEVSPDGAVTKAPAADLDNVRNCWNMAFPAFVESAIRWTKWRDVQSHLDKFQPGILTDDQAWAALRIYVDYLIDSAKWAQLLDTIETNIPSMNRFERQLDRLRFQVVREFAYSDIDTQKLTKKERDMYLDLTKHVVNGNWRPHLSVKEMGAALERGGEYSTVLPFYENFVQADDLGVRDFSRLRWLSSKQRQAARAYERGRGEAALHELDQTAREWGVDPNQRLTDFPHLQPEIISGLPSGTPVDKPTDDSLHFSVQRYDVRINTGSRLVLLTDTETYQTLRIDIKDSTIAGSDDVRQSRDETGGSVSFFVPRSGLRGALFPTEKTSRVKLHFAESTVAVRL